MNYSIIHEVFIIHEVLIIHELVNLAGDVALF